MNPLVILSVSFALAFLVESMVEWGLGIPMDKIPKLTPYKWLLQYAAAGVGVGLAIFYSLDLIALIAQQAGGEIPITAVGEVLSGLAIGRGANYLHQFVSVYFPDKA